MSLRPRLSACREPRGGIERDLTIGPHRIRFTGLDAERDNLLAERWEGFWTPPAGDASLTVATVQGDGSPWLAYGQPGERYRLEAERTSDGVLIASYHFALMPESPSAWKLAVEDTSKEPIGRILDNAARYLTARLVVEGGGVPLHGAGVLRDGRAFVFAGPSRSGKTTAVSLSAPGTSLGDDFAVLLRTPRGWEVPAVPFDNAETAPATNPPAPLALVCRLHQAAAPRLERPQGPMAHAALMACAAFPWALPDLLDRLHDAVDDVVTSGHFAELWFAKEPSFWELLD